MSCLLLIFTSVVVVQDIVLGNFNFFMNQSETQRLLGYQADMYYVRDGVVNHKALTFHLPIRTDISDIYFNWQSLKKQEESALHYTINFDISNSLDLEFPTTSLEGTGTIPIEKSVFRVTLQCKKKVNAEIDVSIMLNISQISPSNYTLLEIKRKKMCLKISKDLFGGREDEMSKLNEIFLQKNFSFYGVPETSSQYFYIGVGSASGFIIIMALVVAACHMRLKKFSDDKQSTSCNEHGYLKVDTVSSSFENNRSPTQNEALKGISMSYGDLRSADARSILQEVEIEASSVSFEELLMEGSYGRIFTGRLIGCCEIVERGDVDRRVLIKTLSGEATKEQLDDFLRSGCLMKDLPSENVSMLIAACIQEDCRPMLLYPYNDDTNLKKYLINCQTQAVPRQQVTMEQLVYAAIQIAHGVHFLHKKHVVHRDLGSRNCLINNHLVVKVTDPALSHDLFPSDYDRLETAEFLPVRWLAPEVMLNYTYSPSSDVWAFGVTLWELMTLCQLPYEGVTSSNIITFLQDGYRLSQPSSCPNEIFAMMACCWCSPAEDRPSFVQLQRCLQNYYGTLMQKVSS